MITQISHFCAKITISEGVVCAFLRPVGTQVDGISILCGFYGSMGHWWDQWGMADTYFLGWRSNRLFGIAQTIVGVGNFFKITITEGVPLHVFVSHSLPSVLIFSSEWVRCIYGAKEHIRQVSLRVGAILRAQNCPSGFWSWSFWRQNHNFWGVSGTFLPPTAS